MKILLKTLYSMANLGVEKSLPIEDVQKIRLTNILAILPVPICIYFLIIGLYNGFTFLWMVCIFLMLGIACVLFINYKQKYITAKAVSFFLYSFCVFIIHNSININYSVICFFFPIFISYEIIYDVKKHFNYFLPNILFTALCAIACFLVPKYLLFQTILPGNISGIVEMSVLIFALVLGALYMYIVISIHMQTEKKLINAMKGYEIANKAKEEFLSNMSHELRTPLNGIIGTTNLLMHEPATPSQQKYYDVLRHTSDHMLHLVNHILDFSKINEGKLNLDRNIFNLKHIITKLCSVYSAQNTQEQVVFNFEIDEELNKDVISDDLRLKQILFNLLSNAFKFTKKGTITLRSILLSSTNEKMFIRFSVQDTGIGIQPEQLGKIFESFEQADSSTTRNFGGTGLGLSISKQLVGLMGGKLQVESEYKKGSTFFFDLEFEINNTAVAKEIEQENIKNLNGLRILVAEDNKVNMMVLLSFLKKWNVQFTDTVNGMQAMEHYKKSDYDLILMDLEMPEMDGYSAIQEIRKLDTTTPVIAFTAALYDGMATDLKSKGFDDYLHKPFNPTDLYNKISRYSK
jgi:signal transduction histidine kinase